MKTNLLPMANGDQISRAHNEMSDQRQVLKAVITGHKIVKPTTNNLEVNQETSERAVSPMSFKSPQGSNEFAQHKT